MVTNAQRNMILSKIAGVLSAQDNTDGAYKVASHTCMDMKDELGQRLLKLGNSGMSDMMFNRYASDYHNAFDAADFNKIAELDAQSGLMSCYATDLTPASTMQILQNYKMAAAAAGCVRPLRPAPTIAEELRNLGVQDDKLAAELEGASVSKVCLAHLV